ncbi:class I SAM-dependent methyltransferase, partial [bacterium]|nr:class I SAM-dependent methyltransferase [bacterium]
MNIFLPKHSSVKTKDPTKRFSDRVDNYSKYRPSYPAKIISLLNTKCDLTKDDIIADIGSGTGILTKLFLDYGNKVFGIEPNKEMREVAEKLLDEYANFVSVDAVAESTKLQSNSIDLLTAGQAFHWFKQDDVKEEFKRILKPEGWIVLVWNIRLIESSQFMNAYEDLLIKHAPDYLTVSHKNIESEVIRDFFIPNSHESTFFPNMQYFDFKGLKGRLMSSS